MKKYLSLLSMLFAVNFTYGQNSNPWPTNGNVGIGTITPDVNLHVWEASDSRPGGSISPTKSVLKLSRNGTPYYAFPESAEFRIGHGGPNLWGSQLDLYLNSGNNQSNIPDQQAMTWLYNGNVGVGTTAPDEKLVVNGSIKTILDSYPTFLSKNVVHIIPLGASGLTGAQNWAIRGVYQYGNGVGLNNDGGDLDVIKSMNGITVLATKFDGSALGNVGIGTTDAKGYRLAVNGSAIATSVTVKEYINWPDYVFKPIYKLPSLSEVKAYIDQNQHLPEMPSAAEVEKEGINLGEMNKLLVKKVEELTLYLIEKDKQIDEQKKLNEIQQQIDQVQQRQIDDLRTRINKMIKL